MELIYIHFGTSAIGLAAFAAELSTLAFINKTHSIRECRIFICDNVNKLDEKNKMVNSYLQKNREFFLRFGLSGGLEEVQISDFVSFDDIDKLTTLFNASEALVCSSEYVLNKNEKFTKNLNRLIKTRRKLKTPVRFLSINTCNWSIKYKAKVHQNFHGMSQENSNRQLLICDYIIDLLHYSPVVIAGKVIVTIERESNCKVDFLDEYLFSYADGWFRSLVKALEVRNRHRFNFRNLLHVYTAVGCIHQIIAVFAAALRKRRIQDFVKSSPGKEYLRLTIEAVVFLFNIKDDNKIFYIHGYQERLSDFPIDIYKVLPWLIDINNAEKMIFVIQMQETLNYPEIKKHQFSKIQIILFFFELINRIS